MVYSKKRYKAYPEYKDSGVEWVDVLPKDWSTVYLKMLIDVRDGTHETPQYIDKTEDSYPLVTSKDVSNGRIDLSDCKYISKEDYESIIKRSAVAKNDILMPMIGTVGSPLLVKNHVDIAIKNLALFRTSDSDSKVLPRFLLYFLSSDECNLQFTLEGRGGVQNFVSLGTLRNLGVPLISKTVQEKVANFLDYETAKIDTLIEKQQRLIELLTEKRQAVISHTVTKGLDPDVPMKDSGVEWLGEVPAHWKVGRTGYYGNVLNGSTPSKANESYWHPKEIAWLSSGAVNQYHIIEASDFISRKALKECSVSLLPKGTLVMGMIGQGKTRGMSAVTKIEATINQNLAAVIPSVELNSNYGHLFFQAAYKILREDARGGNQAALNCDIIKDFKIAIPPIDEQISIFKTVESVLNSYDSLIEKCEKAIQLMQERRTALISAAVTGKIDVRDWVKPE